MQDLVQELIHIVTRFGAVIALFPASFKIFAWVEDRLSIKAKAEISAWLKSTGNVAENQIFSFNLSRFHNQLFGSKQFSLSCVKRSILFSFISYVLIMLHTWASQAFIIYKYGIFPLSNNYITVSLSGTQAVLIYIIIFLLLFILIVFPLDFLGIGVTRNLATRAKNHIGLKTGLLIFLLDTFVKAVVFPIILIISGVTILLAFLEATNYVAHIDLLKLNHIDLDIAQILRQLLKEVTSLSSLVSMLASMLMLWPFRLVVPCFLLCSAWVWLYLIGLHLVRRAVFLFDVDKQPVRSIGIIGATVITGCYGLYTMAVGPNQVFLYAFNLDRLAIIYEQHYDRAIADYSEAIRLDPTDTAAFISRGVAYQAKEDYDRAIADYSEAIRLDPKNAIAFNNRGWAYEVKQDYDRAITDYSEAIRLDPKNAIAFTNRGWVYSRKQDYDRAIADYDEAVRINPTYPRAVANRARAHSAKRDYGHAITDYIEAIRLDPKYSFAFDLRRKEYAPDCNCAIGGFSEAIRLEPKSARAFNNRGWAYDVKQDYDRAIADYTEAIRLNPKYAVAFANRGFAYASKEDYDRAIADYNEAIRLNPKDAVAFADRGLAYASKEDYDRAIADYNEAIRLNPKDAVAFESRGEAYVAKQDYDRAIADLSEAIRLDPKLAPAFESRGEAYGAEQDYDRAITDYNEAIRLDPEDAVAFANRGNAYLGKQDYDHAFADYTEAIRLDPKLPGPFFYNRGNAYAAKQDYDRAMADYTEAIRLDPKFAPAFESRGEAYVAKQDYDHAIADFSEAIRLDTQSADAVLWLYLARTRLRDQSATRELATNSKNLKRDWPFPVVELFLGRRTPKATLAAAIKPDDRCEAQFYVGEWGLLRGERTAAMGALKAAVDNCPQENLGYALARAELQRLRP
jgi:tetratricopeptide (TPR) repeat protein